MKNFRAADKSHAGGDEKYDINFHWPYGLYITFIKLVLCDRVDVTILLICIHSGNVRGSLLSCSDSSK